MRNSDMPAMPIVVPASEKPEFYASGLSKREHFAAMAMQGIFSSIHAVENLNQEEFAMEAISMADALLKALEKTNEE